MHVFTALGGGIALAGQVVLDSGPPPAYLGFQGPGFTQNANGTTVNFDVYGNAFCCSLTVRPALPVPVVTP